MLPADQEIVFTDARTNLIMTSPLAGSIPFLMKSAVAFGKDIEDLHMQKMSEIIFDTYFKEVPVSDIKQIFAKAGPPMATLTQKVNELKFLIQKHNKASKDDAEHQCTVAMAS